ncbi:Neprilysin-4 [Formica fusca]
MAKQLYQSCIDEDSRERRGLKPIQQMLDATGGWPILMSEEEWDAKNYTWQKMDNDYFKLYTFPILFNILFSTDYENPRIMILSSLQQPLGNKIQIDTQKLPYDMYMDTIMKVVCAFAKDKGIQIPVQKLLMDVGNLMEFEIDLKNIIGYNEKITPVGNKMTIAELQEYYDLAGAQHATAKINWLDKIQIAFKFFDITIDASETVLIFNKEILHKLAHLLDITPQHVIVNYLQWHVVSTFMGNLNKQMRDIELDLYYSYDIKLHDKLKQEQRWLKCIKAFEMKDIVILPFIYGSKTSTSINEMLNILDIFDDIKKEMMNYIKSLMWLNKLTKNFMVQKINNISLNIGYSEWYRHQIVLAQMYKGLEIGNNYFTNVLAIIKYQNIIKQRSFRDKSSYRWSFDFLSDNPSYDHHFNEIYIPVTIMQFPYLSANVHTAYANYGGIGSVIGQQLAHVVNLYIGLYFDNYGNLKLDTEIRHAYERRTHCVFLSIMNNIEQYHSFILNITIKNPEYIQSYKNLIKDEGVAHFIGTQIAFAALKRKSSFPMLSDHQSFKITKDTAEDISRQPRKIQNIVSQERLFFLHNAMITCGTTFPYNEDFNNIRAIKAQINSNLANIKKFSEVFDCPVDSPMNPKLKCKTWNEATPEEHFYYGTN